MNPIEGKYLGKSSATPEHYSPELILPVPRQLNRNLYGIHEDSLPFEGLDIWHAYELSFLTKKGLPVTGLLKIIYPANSPFIVESKSLKLYLNSFNMEPFGSTPAEGISNVLSTIRCDLEKALATNVVVNYFNDKAPSTIFDFSEYSILEETTGIENELFSHYSESPHLLKPSKLNEGTLKTGTHLLRSNCKITNQPDWGSAYIYLKNAQGPSPESLLKYIVSLRNENHFHEEVCELIYKRLLDIFSPEELMVTCLYTRRGGIDICPARASHSHLLPPALTNAEILSKKMLRQ